MLPAQRHLNLHLQRRQPENHRQYRGWKDVHSLSCIYGRVGWIVRGWLGIWTFCKTENRENWRFFWIIILKNPNNPVATLKKAQDSIPNQKRSPWKNYLLVIAIDECVHCRSLTIV